MRLPSAMLLASLLLVPLQAREVLYPGAEVASRDQLIPKFENGYLLFLDLDCRITVYAPGGQLAFTRDIESPGVTPCHTGSAAADTDGTVAVSIVYADRAGYTAGLALFDAKGRQISFSPTKQYVPSSICFDNEHTVWSIGWQRSLIRNDMQEESDYPLVRRFQRDGQQIGAYLPRSLWPAKTNPASVSQGHWRIAAAKDRIGAVLLEKRSDYGAEWVEWGLDGQLLSRTRLPKFHAGRAYTSSGRFFGCERNEQTSSAECRELDKKTGRWRGTPMNLGSGNYVLGADEDHLVLLDLRPGSVRLTWIKPPDFSEAH